MATVNGDTPATASSTADTPMIDHSATKRKRENDTTDASEHLSHLRLQKVQRDILEVLARHDTEPSLLEYTLDDSKTSLSNEPSPKKARLSDATGLSLSISQKLRNAHYTSLRQIQLDAARVAEDIAALLRAKAKDREGYNAGRPTVDELKQINKVQSLAALVKDIVAQETQFLEPEQTVDIKKESVPTSNGKVDGSISTNTGRVSSVLTLFGNAPTPKQLFSSMQHSTGSALVKSELPIEEMGLPNGISATKIIGAPASEDTTGPTFDQAFAPPYNLAALPPPKAHKRSATRETAVTWEFKDSIHRNKRGGYTVQPLSTGDWLCYGSGDGEDPSSPREKRKLRDRALSSADGSAPKPKRELSEEAARREEEALFRRAYSSFAPTRDDSNAIVSEATKSEVWWHKVGEKRFQRTFAIDPALLDTRSSSVPVLENSLDEDKIDFSRIIQDLDELEQMKPEQYRETATSKTDVEQVLCKVTDLLETLASHQRIRNATLATATPSSRPPVSPGPASSRAGMPDQPSEEEISTYNSLRRELCYLLLKLPPYAVAKLDGDQLAELGVKQVFPYQQKDVRGVMEEDLVTRQAKLAQQATAASIANLARPSSSAGQHYNQTAQRTPAIGQAANTRYGQQYTGRPPPTISQFQRQASTPSSYGSSTTAGRPSYGQTQQYRPGAPQTGYGQANGQQYYQQRPLQQTAGSYSSYNQQTPLQQRPTYGSGPSQPQYQQRAQSNAAANYHNSAVAPQHAYNRNISPIKPGHPTPSQPIAAQQQRPMYPAQPLQQQPQQPGSGRATPVSYPSQPNTPVNGYPHARPMQGLAPRPTSTTPQPPLHTGPPQPPPPQQAMANGTS